MGQIQESVIVKIVSRETIKPSSPTPPHLKNYNLSYLNQILPLVPIFPTCVLVFYTATPQTQPLDITHLKSCLSQALVKFYTLAGKANKSSVNCNDEGIPFVVAKAECSLSDFLNSPRKLEVMAKFVPPTESLGMGGEQPILELTQIAIQVTTFACGGVSIGWYDAHKVLDGISAATFFKYWAGLASHRPESLIVQPDLYACIAAFPPTTKSLQLPVVNVYKEEVERSPTVAKSFIFTTSAINELKAKVVSDKVPKPTSFQAIAGFLWEQALSVSKNNEHGTKGSVLHVTLDIRPRVNPPLPNGAIGNLAVIAVARAENKSRLPELVTEISSAVSDMKEEMKEYQGENGVEALLANWGKVINSLVEYKDRAYRLISWSRLGFSDLDFGFGKPILMLPTDGKMSPFHRNMIILNDYRDSQGDGIEAWMFLEEKEMMALDSSKEFLAYASPRPTAPESAS